MTAVAVAAACTSADSPVVERPRPAQSSTSTAAASGAPLRLPAAPRPSRRSPLVGAHTYNWYPANWGAGTLRDRLVPPQQPALGRYSSDDPRAAERQIAWASAHGIDFFTVDWWPTREDQDDVIRRGFLSARNRSDLRFCIFYEAWAGSFLPEQGVTPVDAGVVRRFGDDLLHLARTYFGEPGYLRIRGRPVVVVYLTRTMTGDVAGMVRSARERLRAEGHDPFLIADEIHWANVPEDAPLRGPVRKVPDPQPGRALLFDALTAYTIYDPANTHHAGYASETSLVPDVNDLYERYRVATGGRVPIAPSVVPGYDDRGVRPGESHFVLPRQWAAGGPDASLLGELLDRTAYPNLDDRAPLLFLTTWNEWNEDTSIEPMAEAAPTSRDSSPSGRAYTDGYSFAGDGFAALEAVRDRVAAVAGRVTGAGGRPLAGVAVYGWRDGDVVAGDRTDHDGRYLLRRAQVGVGPLQVGLGPTAAGARRIAVDAQRTVAGVDLAASG